MRVYVDTNVIIDFCLERNDKYDLRYLFAFDFFKRGKDCEFHLVISDWAQDEARNHVEKEKIEELKGFVSEKLISAELTPALEKEATKYKNWPDARHAIIARDMLCDYLATSDDDFDAFSHIVRNVYPQNI